jgi:hypothetical protein
VAQIGYALARGLRGGWLLGKPYTAMLAGAQVGLVQPFWQSKSLP